MHSLVAAFCLLACRGSVISPSIQNLIISNYSPNQVQFTINYTCPSSNKGLGWGTFIAIQSLNANL
jgi:hypothetical protein